MDSASVLSWGLVICIGLFILFRKSSKSSTLKVGMAAAKSGWTSSGYIPRPDGLRDIKYKKIVSRIPYEIFVDAKTGVVRVLDCPEIGDMEFPSADMAEMALISFTPHDLSNWLFKRRLADGSKIYQKFYQDELWEVIEPPTGAFTITAPNIAMRVFKSLDEVDAFILDGGRDKLADRVAEKQKKYCLEVYRILRAIQEDSFVDKGAADPEVNKALKNIVFQCFRKDLPPPIAARFIYEAFETANLNQNLYEPATLVRYLKEKTSELVKADIEKVKEIQYCYSLTSLEKSPEAYHAGFDKAVDRVAAFLLKCPHIKEADRAFIATEVVFSACCNASVPIDTSTLLASTENRLLEIQPVDYESSGVTTWVARDGKTTQSFTSYESPYRSVLEHIEAWPKEEALSRFMAILGLAETSEASLEFKSLYEGVILDATEFLKNIS